MGTLNSHSAMNNYVVTMTNGSGAGPARRGLNWPELPIFHRLPKVRHSAVKLFFAFIGGGNAANFFVPTTVTYHRAEAVGKVGPLSDCYPWGVRGYLSSF